MESRLRHLPFLAAALALFLSAPAHAADTVKVSDDGGYARLLFRFDKAAQARAGITGTVLTLAFDRAVSIDPKTIGQALPGLVASVHAEPDGRHFSFALTQTVRLHTSTVGNRTAIDLVPQSFRGTPPDLPLPPPPPPKAVDVAALPPLAVRSGAYHNFTRIVFDWTKNVPYAVFPGAGKLTIRFEATARPDFSVIDREAPPWVKAAGWHIENKGTVVDLETDADSGYHDFRDGTHIVIDVLAPKTDADAYNPPGEAKPAVTALRPGKPQNAAITPAQAEAIQNTAAKLNAPKAPPAPEPQATAPPKQLGGKITPAPAAAPQPAPQQQTQDTAPATQQADSKLTRDGAVLVFAGAGRKGSAVFMRGLTAWIILQDAAPLDATKLKAQLGTFPDAVDAASSGGVSVLRVTLKKPEAIAAYPEGSNLKVVIAPQVSTTAIAIGFSRNQDDPTHSSLSTLLPGATKAIPILDPVAGDELTVVPSQAGRAMLDARTYVEFATLKTASGLVLEPYVDNLEVALDRTRVTITRPGGLSLTPPTMPVADTPESLARGGQGPCFLDFAAWGRITGGSFLATERRLRWATARLSGAKANHARLVLARFYLAHHFDAEALGLINLMQADDPALESDLQLQTMRAAAEYEMGRYREAHNDLAGARFDSDRNAAFWRGLIEAAQEDWKNAHADLDRAGPVLVDYEPEWVARARLANAEAALGLGHLEIADAQIARLPGGLPQDLAIEAELDRARLYAGENRFRDAAALFDAVEAGPDEKAAEAIYYRVSAAMAAGAMPPAQAINALERLRFRWRGDLLELKTLRKLASLYFAQKRWHEGLRTLRVAVQNFPNDDQAITAQDDMRAAFVDLFLKGKANAMKPVDALGLFYDFIDLTPIGPEGDEMIRRMADRLVAVDLLGPAEDLLDYQVTKRLDGVARAQVAARLAGIYLMDHKPQPALDILNATRLATIPDDVNHARLLIEARALAQMKRWDQAIDLIAVDQAPDTARLRADIYWESGNWAMAGQTAEALLGARGGDAAPLTPDARQLVLRMAVAYSLANDETSLERVRDAYAAKMKSGPDASAFAVLTQRIDLHGVAFRDAAAKVASIDTLQTFMKDLQSNAIATN